LLPFLGKTLAMKFGGREKGMAREAFPILPYFLLRGFDTPQLREAVLAQDTSNVLSVLR